MAKKNKEHIAGALARQMCSDLHFKGGETLSEIKEHFSYLKSESDIQAAICEVAAVLG